MNFTCALRYRRLLSPYIDGELNARARSRLEQHLEGCSGCRSLCTAMSVASRLVSSIAVPDEVPAPDGFRRRLANAQRPRSRASRIVFSPATAVLLVVVAAGAVLYYTHPSNSPWEVTRLDGTPIIGSQSVIQTAHLGEGQWLETDAESRATVSVGGIGQLQVEPNTRVKLVQTSVTEHRLSLERGRLQATIWAPPRLFFVDTPSAEAVDLGCAFTIEVDDDDRGLLHVTSGWVALHLDGRESKVPAGAICETRPVIGPGTPYFADSSAPLQQALTKLDFEGGGTKALDLVLADARAKDTLTLYHLLARVEEADRGRVYDRLAQYNRPPAGVTREGIMRLDGEMLLLWREALEPTWLKERRTVLRKLWRWIWS